MGKRSRTVPWMFTVLSAVLFITGFGLLYSSYRLSSVDLVAARTDSLLSMCLTSLGAGLVSMLIYTKYRKVRPSVDLKFWYIPFVTAAAVLMLVLQVLPSIPPALEGALTFISSAVIGVAVNLFMAALSEEYLKSEEHEHEES